MKPLITLAIVDDDKIFVALTKKIIEQNNLVDQIKVFENGQEAINYLKENSNNPNLLPDIILLDLLMPVMDGWQFLEEYVKLKPTIRKTIYIDIVTSSTSAQEVGKAKSISAVSDFIIKTISKEKFIEVIKSLTRMIKK